jgi:hypothetical protein
LLHVHVDTINLHNVPFCPQRVHVILHEYFLLLLGHSYRSVLHESIIQYIILQMEIG